MMHIGTTLGAKQGVNGLPHFLGSFAADELASNGRIHQAKKYPEYLLVLGPPTVVVGVGNSDLLVPLSLGDCYRWCDLGSIEVAMKTGVREIREKKALPKHEVGVV
jgi:hypothetical protein